VNPEIQVKFAFLLLAEEELYRGRGNSSQYLLLVAAAVAVILAIVGFYFWNASRKPRDGRSEEASPEDVLAELCRVHDLSRAEQALILTVARNERLAQPAAIFIDPQPLDRAAEGVDPDAPRYRALRQKLFGLVN
jgi:hypothetical protein